MIASVKTSTKVLQAMLFCGILMIFAATAQAVIAPTAPPGFPASLVNCGDCHNLTVNGIVLTTGGFTVPNVVGRDANTWASTITRMINTNFCQFPAGDTTALANYLASVGAATTTTTVPATTTTTVPATTTTTVPATTTTTVPATTTTTVPATTTTTVPATTTTTVPATTTTVKPTTTTVVTTTTTVKPTTTTTIKKKRDCDDRSDDRSGHRRGHHRGHRDHRSDDCRDDRSDDHSGKHK